MKSLMCVFTALALITLSVGSSPEHASAASETTLVGFTGKPHLTANTFSPVRLSRNPEYVLGSPSPKNPPKNVMYGSIRLGGTSRPYQVRGDSQRGYTIVLDLNGNGDLADETAVTLTATGKPYRRPGFPAPLEVTFEYGDPLTPLKLVLQLDENGEPNETIHRYFFTERRGELTVGGRIVRFVLLGVGGIYDDLGKTVFFDLNADGAIDTSDRYSIERVDVRTGYVIIDGTAYEFAVDPYGDYISLTAAMQSLPQPHSLDPGVLAPDFSFLDLAGFEHRLSDYRGRVLLLYFWGTWCPPCRSETPDLVKAYAAFKDQGFEIVGINKRDDQRTIEAYMNEHGVEWTQNMQGEDGPILELYRVVSYPMSFLVGRDGRIVARPVRAKDLAAQLEHIVHSGSQP